MCCQHIKENSQTYGIHSNWALNIGFSWPNCSYFEQKRTVPCYLSHLQYHFCKTVWYLKIFWLRSRVRWPRIQRLWARAKKERIADDVNKNVVEHFTFTNIFLALSDFFFSEWIWYPTEGDALLGICWRVTINFEFRLVSCSIKSSVKISKSYLKKLKFYLIWNISSIWLYS